MYVTLERPGAGLPGLTTVWSATDEPLGHTRMPFCTCTLRSTWAAEVGIRLVYIRTGGLTLGDLRRGPLAEMILEVIASLCRKVPPHCSCTVVQCMHAPIEHETSLWAFVGRQAWPKFPRWCKQWHARASSISSSNQASTR